jgi:dienelactone hydrolase
MVHQPAIDAFASYVRDSGAGCEVFEYPVSGHLFTDASLPAEYDADATQLVWPRVTEFLRRLLA